MAPKDGKAAVIFNLATEKSLREAANNTIAKDSLKLIDSQNLTVNGFPAVAMTAEQEKAKRSKEPKPCAFWFM